MKTLINEYYNNRKIRKNKLRSNYESSNLKNDRNDYYLRFEAFFVSITLAILFWHPVIAQLPGPGFDEFESVAEVDIDLGFGLFHLKATGPTKIKRGTPRIVTPPCQIPPCPSFVRIPTEIVQMELRGNTSFGPIIIKESACRQSIGYIQGKNPAPSVLPAIGFLNVFVEIETPFGVFHNEDTIRLINFDINQLPPLGSTYNPVTILGVPLLNSTGQVVGCIIHASHHVGQRPSFSVAPGGPSGLAPGDIFNVPTSGGILTGNLGLFGLSDLDALSYGNDFVPKNINKNNLRFSVDPFSVGVLGSAVFIQAIGGEAHGDEFQPVGISNIQILDEDGSSAPPFPLLISDDVDALVEPPTSFVDPDNNTVPDFPVYFSLGPTSIISFILLGATPADILTTVGGGMPTIFISEAAIGLGLFAPGDDLDAMCIDIGPDSIRVLFSLAAGSPTLAGTGTSPADLFLVTIAGPPFVPLGAPPSVVLPAASLGLLATDNLNALKCVRDLPPFIFPLCLLIDNACDAEIAPTPSVNRMQEVAFDNTLATVELNEPMPQFGGCNTQSTWCDASLDNTVWFRFQAPISGNLILETHGFDTQLTLFEDATGQFRASCNICNIGSGSANFNLLNLIAANDDGARDGIGSRIDACGLIPGQTYYIQIDGKNGATGTGTLAISNPGPSPSNDDVISATLLAFQQPVTVNNTCATPQPGEPVPSTWPNPLTNSVWATVATSAPGSFVNLFSDFDSQIAIYEVTNPKDFNTYNEVIATTFLGSGLILQPLVFGLTPGVTYMIQIDGMHELGGNTILEHTNSFMKTSENNAKNISKVNSVSLGAYPNPFSNSTTIQFNLTEESNVTLEVFNLNGIKVESVFEGVVDPDNIYSVEFDGKDLPNGIYYCTLKTDDGIYYEKMVLVSK
ncbi:MAG: T9SS type A sorting domain-containing protein [Bacteroidetes bacterium]|nr:T9SS type A sorting domain-containing protein [Bacteroidota bacterium]